MSGSSTFPTTVDNKVQVTDGVDIIQADDINDAYVPIDAIEAFIGVSGAAQSHNTDMLAQIFSLKPTIRLIWNSTTALTASAGVARPQNSGGTVRKMRRNTTTTTITPTLGASTNYYVYANGDAAATTAAFAVDTNATTPTGVTCFELIGGFSTDGSSHIIRSSIWSVAGLRLVNLS